MFKKNLNILRKIPQSYKFFASLNNEKQKKIANFLPISQSEIGQDLFVLSEIKDQKRGYFVEFGATNGYTISNTYILEKDLGWEGILAEPCKYWHKELTKNRECIIETKWIDIESGRKINFMEYNSDEYSARFSSIKDYSNIEKSKKNNIRSYDVETLSLNDLLNINNAPNTIDYLSIDSEGNEFEILNSYDFEKRKINIITVEHNYNKKK